MDRDRDRQGQTATDRDRQGQQEILATRWTNARTRSPLSSWTIYARLANRVQITIDGHSAYLEAVEGAFSGDVDFAQLVKIYGKPIGKKGYERKYSPSECVGNTKRFVTATPNVLTSARPYVERRYLTMWLGMRRFTLLANAFSKQLANRLTT